MVTYYALILAGALIGLYDSPAKCEADKALKAQWYTPATLATLDLKCERRTLPE